MKVYRIFLLFQLLSCLGKGQAQELKLGSKFPTTTLKDLYNSDADSIEIAPGNRKLWLLEFWGTGCSACLKSFTKLDSINSRFGKSVQVILINRESKDSTLKYLAKRKVIRLPKDVPFHSGDTMLNQLFPHFFVPHLVWIDSTNTVVSITYGANATVSNILRYLQGDHLDLVVKKDTVLKDYSDDELKLAQLARDNDALEYYSYLTKFIPGLPGGAGVRNKTRGGPIHQIHVDQATVLDLYRVAYSEWHKLPYLLHSNSVDLKIRDSTKYIPPSDINLYYSWKVKNSYSYRLNVPEEKAKQLFNFMKKDLERLFGLNAYITRKKISCIVLSRSKNLRTIKKDNKIDSSNSLRFSWSRFTWLLRKRIDNEACPEPFMNLIRFKSESTIFINKHKWESWSSTNLEPLLEELEKYGIIISKRLQKVNVLVITDGGN